MNEIVRIAAVAITAALCATVIRKQTPEIGIVLVLAGGTVIFALAMTSLESVVSFLDELADTAGLSPAVLAPVFKVAGIAIIAKIAAEVCRDAKEGGLAAFVETAASALALWVTLPLLRTVLATVSGLI